MAERFVQRKWGQVIDSTDAHIEYLEEVRRRHADRPDFRGAELRQTQEDANFLRSRMKDLGKRRSDAFWPTTVYSA